LQWIVRLPGLRHDLGRQGVNGVLAMMFRSHLACVALLSVVACASHERELEHADPVGPLIAAPAKPEPRTWTTSGPMTPMPPGANWVLDEFERHKSPVFVPVPPPSSFENSCAPAPYVFQSNAGYEAVRVKDCRHDQLVYLPASETARIGRFVEECKRICSGLGGTTATP
jgi:hypothetical protein